MPRRAPDVLRRLALRVKHGVQRPDALYEALRRNPPPLPPVLKKPLEEIVLPTDDLEEDYRRKREEAGSAPAVPLNAPGEDPAGLFAARQHDLMERQGLDATAAAAAVEAEDLEGDRTAAAAATAAADAPWPAAHLAERARFRAEDEPDPREVDAWLIAEVLRWDWAQARRAHEQLAVADVEGEQDASPLARAVIALRRRALDEPAPAADGFELSAGVDKAFLQKHDALAERAAARPWDEWNADERAEMDAFLAGLSVDGGDDDLRLAAFPEFEHGDRVRVSTDAEAMATTLASHGVFPELDEAALEDLLDKGITKAENKHVTDAIREDLADDASRSRRRAAAARRAHVEQAFFDRIGFSAPSSGGSA